MTSVFITGSADGLGRLAAQRMVMLGHDVVLHGRDRHRAEEAMRAVPGARTAVRRQNLGRSGSTLIDVVQPVQHRA